MSKPQSPYQRHPDYRVDLAPSDQALQARFGEIVVAQSRKALIVSETKHDPVVYFPLEDVVMEYFTATEHHTFCPFKGQASYWTLRHNGTVAENVMWAYLEPIAEVAGLKGYAAFYSDRVQVAPSG